MKTSAARYRSAAMSGSSGAPILRQSRPSRAVLRLAAAVPLLACAGALPRLIQLGSVTPAGVTSALFVVLGAALLWTHPITAPAAVRLSGIWSLLVLWALLSMVSEGISILGIQEITVIGLAPLLILLTAGQSWLHRGWHREVERIMSIQFWGLIVVSVVQWVAFETTHNDTLNIRPIAMSAVFLGAWYMGEYIAAGTGVRRIVVLGLLVTLTLSRMAFAIYLAATLVSLIARSLRVRKTARKQATVAATAFIAVAALGVGMVFVGGPLHSRSSQGDVSLKVLGVSINGEGRADFWRTLRNESTGVGLTGMGAGAAERVITDNFNDIGQPHNDYLKLWFNFGWTGLALFLGGWVMVMYRLISALRTGGLSQDDLVPIAAAFLSGLALLVFMTTDNPVAYAPVTGQWALVVGTALGASGRTNPRRRAAATSR